MIVDGTFLQRAELAGAWDFVVFVEASADAAGARGAERDADHLDGIDAAREMHQKRYQPAFAIYSDRCRPRDRAHLVIGNDEPSAPRILWTAEGVDDERFPNRCATWIGRRAT